MEIIILLGVFVLGLSSTVVYYFARFFIFKNQGEAQIEGKTPETEPKKIKAPPVKSLSDVLLKSKKSMWFRSGGVAGEEVASLEELEESLYTADLGPQTVSYLIDKVKEKQSSSFELEEVKSLFKKEMELVFEEDNSKEFIDTVLKGAEEGPYVISIVGVNGAGKTTTIGKLAHMLGEKGQKVMVAAGDTFRAAAEHQLDVWAERSDALIFKAPPETKDPGAVAFQAYEKAKKENADILIIDTAGRLHTQQNLMNELEKVGRVLKKHDEQAPHAVWMIVDSNTGMNAFHQTESFHKAVGVTGVIMTKVDGSAKAGTAIGIRHSLGIPILMLGTGEGAKDLKLFQQKEFIESLV